MSPELRLEASSQISRTSSTPPSEAPPHAPRRPLKQALEVSLLCPVAAYCSLLCPGVLPSPPSARVKRANRPRCPRSHIATRIPRCWFGLSRLSALKWPRRTWDVDGIISELPSTKSSPAQNGRRGRLRGHSGQVEPSPVPSPCLSQSVRWMLETTERARPVSRRRDGQATCETPLALSSPPPPLRDVD